MNTPRFPVRVPPTGGEVSPAAETRISVHNVAEVETSGPGAARILTASGVAVAILGAAEFVAAEDPERRTRAAVVGALGAIVAAGSAVIDARVAMASERAEPDPTIGAVANSSGFGWMTIEIGALPPRRGGHPLRAVLDVPASASVPRRSPHPLAALLAPRATTPPAY